MKIALNELCCTDSYSYLGFISWKATEGTFTRNIFYDAFCENVVPFLNPWPLPHSIVILDNAKIHMFNELEDAVHQCGARLLFLPPIALNLTRLKYVSGN